MINPKDIDTRFIGLCRIGVRWYRRDRHSAKLMGSMTLCQTWGAERGPAMGHMNAKDVRTALHVEMYLEWVCSQHLSRGALHPVAWDS